MWYSKYPSSRMSSRKVVEGDERWGALERSPGVLSQNWGGNEPKRTVMSPARCLSLRLTTDVQSSPGAVGSLVVRASDSRPEGLGSMPDATKYPPSTRGFPCRSCGGEDTGGVAIYRPFGEFRRAESYCHLDEVHFWLNGYVNKQHCRIGSEANPQVYVETPLHPEKLTVWCALWAGGILLQKR
ncbi:hypothetical protein TNCV_1241351 [Trichonephila clavipes]|uniref:Uncharacterized protein n=1 Tax=Trichonephila clavipes TaxID=2585209 RepID=A0A8X7BJ92_TRICX|nr:hypothetical protein TNCV_1241351 [Trichonephila clavipes]